MARSSCTDTDGVERVGTASARHANDLHPYIPSRLSRVPPAASMAARRKAMRTCMSKFGSNTRSDSDATAYAANEDSHPDGVLSVDEYLKWSFATLSRLSEEAAASGELRVLKDLAQQYRKDSEKMNSEVALTRKKLDAVLRYTAAQSDAAPKKAYSFRSFSAFGLLQKGRFRSTDLDYNARPRGTTGTNPSVSAPADMALAQEPNDLVRRRRAGAWSRWFDKKRTMSTHDGTGSQMQSTTAPASRGNGLSHKSSKNSKRPVEVPSERIEDILDRDTLSKLQASQEETKCELEIDLRRAVTEQRSKVRKVMEAQTRLARRRAIDGERMDILDRLFGRVDGWEKDQVALTMLTNLGLLEYVGGENESIQGSWVRKTDSDIEKKYVVEFSTMEEMVHCWDEYESALDAMTEARSTLEVVIKELSPARYVSMVDVFHWGDIAASAGAKVHARLRESQKRCIEASRKMRIASATCRELPEMHTPRVLASELLAVVDIRFDSFRVDLLTRRILLDAIESAKTASKDCHASMEIIRRRMELMKKDVDRCVDNVENLEQQVLVERLKALYALDRRLDNNNNIDNNTRNERSV